MKFRSLGLFVAAVTGGSWLLSSALAADAELRTRLDVAQFDKKVTACRDLNTYVNGPWLEREQIPVDRTTWGSFEQLDDRAERSSRELAEAAAQNLAKADPSSIEYKIGAFYKSGMDEAAIAKAGLTPVAPELERIAALKTPAQIAAYVRETHASGRSVLFRFGGNADYKNSQMVIGYASQGGLALPEKAYYLEDGADGAYKKIREAYVAHLKRLLQLGGVPASAADQQAADVLAFETRLAKASLNRIELRDPAKRYHFVSVAEADQVSPNFPWSAYLDAQGLRGQKGFSLSQPGFFAEVDKMLVDVPAAQWQAYLRARLLDRAAPYLTEALASEAFDFYGKTLRGQAEQRPRWKRVLGSVEDGMGMALGQLYVAKYFPPQAKERARALVEDLRAATKVRLEKLPWMGEETRAKALEKWATFVPKIGYPDEWRDWRGLKIDPGSYYANVLAADKFDRDWDNSKIGKPPDRKEWGMTPQTVNAYYDAQQNEIVFPAAILQPPFFDARADDALNYGGIGAVIGHEMMHGYDDQGSKFDAAGNFDNWWTAEDRKRFEARTQKLVQQFDGYVALDDLHVKGELTLGENIADLGGLNVALDALKLAQARSGVGAGALDGLSTEQRFFLNWAQVWRRKYRNEELKVRLNTDSHAPAAFRAIGPPSNMPAFAAAFGCKAGDPMVRADRVEIW